MQPEVDLSVVLPAYREAENLESILPAIRACLDKVHTKYEIVVVDTPEPMDDTASICGRHGARYVARSPGECYGDAVRSGIAAAGGKWVVFMDADGSHSPEFVVQLLEQAADHDVVIASRYMKGGSTENGFLLTAMSRVLNVTYSVVLGLPCKDVSNSFRLYRGEVLKQLDLNCSNFDIVEEILVRIRACRGKLLFKEIPFHFQAREHGTTKRKLSTFVATYLVTMVRLWSAGRKQSQLDKPLTSIDRQSPATHRKAA